MMLLELSERIAKNMEQRKLKDRLEHELDILDQELDDQSARLVALGDQLDAEKVDVENLERMGITRLFYTVLGSREQQVEKQRQELLSAQLMYRQTKHQVEFLERDRNYLVQRLAELTAVEDEYQSLLTEKEDLLRQLDHPVAGELIDCTEQIAKHEAELQEIRQAIEAGKILIADLERVIDLLGSAQSWGVWDMLGGGLVSSVIKHSRLDDAQQAVNQVQSTLSRFIRELTDVQNQVDIQIEISEFERFADLWFDGLIFDWVVQSKISESLSRTKRTRSIVIQSVEELETRKELTHNQLKVLKIERENIIRSI